MTHLETHLADHTKAVEEFLTAARTLDAQQWTTPRAEGAWSPGQIVQHVSIVYEYSRDVVRGVPTGGSLPRFLRPLLRRFVVDSALKAGQATRKGRAPGLLRPGPVPPPPTEGLARLEAAARVFDAAIRESNGADVVHPFFGRMPAADYVRFQAIHTRHHRRQLTST
jgi:hypothetical protein